MNFIHLNIKLVSLSQHEFYFTIFICDEFLFRQDLREIKFLMSEKIKTKNRPNKGLFF